MNCLMRLMGRRGSLAAMALMIAAVSADVRAGSDLPTCPVTGEPVDFTKVVTTDAGPVFACCGHCVKKMTANLDKYAEGVAAQREALKDRDKVQVICPISGDAVDKKAFVEHDGEKVFFCCSGCISKFEKDPAAYQTKLASSYTYQTKCPVMRETINPKSVTTLANGQKVYFCCNGCEKKLKADPSKYLPNLVAQGFNIKAKDLSGEKDAHGHADGHDHDHDHDD